MLFLLGNVLAPYVAWGIGNDPSLSIPYSMLATILAALVERPFYRWAGITSNDYRLSMQANILSWFVGTILAFGSLLLDFMPVFMLMYFLAVPFSIAIEGSYLMQNQVRVDGKWEWGPGILGNLLSGLLLFATTQFGLWWGDWLRRSGASLPYTMAEYDWLSQSLVLVACCIVFGFALYSKSKAQALRVHDTESSHEASP